LTVRDAMAAARVLALVCLSVGPVGQRVAAAPIAESPMTVTLVTRSESGVFRGTTLVYLDGRIDAGAPDRLSTALEGVKGTIAIWLNSPGGNLFAGMKLGRIIRQHGAETHIIDSRTLLPGECYSACAVAFLGGVYRFNRNGARYGVHRASLRVGSTTGDRDLGQHLTAAIGSYVREMGVDARLLDLWVRAGPDEMYVLSPEQAKDLDVVNNGRLRPVWSVTPFPGGTLLQGRQATADGTGTVFFSCDDTRTVFGSVDEAAGNEDALAAGGWSHLLAIDSHEIPLAALAVSNTDGFIRSTFVMPPHLVRLTMSAKQIGHYRRSSGERSLSLGHRVDVDDPSAATVRRFLARCLRAQKK
jgi:hypothetical protein